MARYIGRVIEGLRDKIGMNATQFGEPFGSSPMSVARWERNMDLPSSRLAVLTLADARAMVLAQARTAAARRS